MKTSFRSQGKISCRSEGLGTVTDEMVRQRAREIALINGRDSKHLLESDWRQARIELIGTEHTSEAGEEESVSGQHGWREEPSNTGHHVGNVKPSDEQTQAERLVQEGVDEAEHEQMVEGSRKTEF
jgi:hypothetical protein